MGQFGIILNQIGGFFLFLALGVTLRKKTNFLNDTALFSISELTIKVALPAFIFNSTVSGTTVQDFIDAFPVLLVIFVLYIGLILLGILLAKIFCLKGNSAHAYRLAFMFGNVGLVGIPIVTELYPKAAVIIIAVATVVDMVMMWTYGVNLSYNVEATGDQNHGLAKVNRVKRILLNPPFLAIVISLLFVFLELPVPTFVNSTLQKIGNMLTPLGMIYIGGNLKLQDIRYVLKRPAVYASIVMKMICIPILLYFVMTRVGIASDMSATLAIIIGVPVFMAVTILTKNNGSDYKLASGMLMLSTVAFMVTYPIVSLVISAIGV